MSNVFVYEPFYGIDRIFDEAVGSRRPIPNGNEGQLQRRATGDGGDGAVRHFKPRMDLHEDAEKNPLSSFRALRKRTLASTFTMAV
ncbi:hypothetical protein H1R20_g10413, partial [Candolleomyces eurysporus]